MLFEFVISTEKRYNCPDQISCYADDMKRKLQQDNEANLSFFLTVQLC